MAKKGIIIVIILVLVIAATAVYLVLSNKENEALPSAKEAIGEKDLSMPAATGNVDDLIDSLEEEIMNEQALIDESDIGIDDFVKTNDIGDIDQVSGEDEL